MDTFFAFLSWLWYYGWRIALVVLGIFFVFGAYLSLSERKKYRRYIRNPTDILPVMSLERWGSRIKIRGYLDAKFSTDFFSSSICFEIYDDFEWLLKEGFIETRVMYYGKSGNELPELTDKCSRDEQGNVIGINRDVTGGDEYRKTGKGGSRSRNDKHTEESHSLHSAPTPQHI